MIDLWKRCFMAIRGGDVRGEPFGLFQQPHHVRHGPDPGSDARRVGRLERIVRTEPTVYHGLYQEARRRRKRPGAEECYYFRSGAGAGRQGDALLKAERFKRLNQPRRPESPPKVSSEGAGRGHPTEVAKQLATARFSTSIVELIRGAAMCPPLQPLVSPLALGGRLGLPFAWSRAQTDLRGRPGRPRAGGKDYLTSIASKVNWRAMLQERVGSARSVPRRRHPAVPAAPPLHPGYSQATAARRRPTAAGGRAAAPARHRAFCSGRGANHRDQARRPEPLRRRGPLRGGKR
jgi:hypothetical protein